jgi:hypothetical protein
LELPCNEVHAAGLRAPTLQAVVTLSVPHVEAVVADLDGLLIDSEQAWDSTHREPSAASLNGGRRAGKTSSTTTTCHIIARCSC